MIENLVILSMIHYNVLYMGDKMYILNNIKKISVMVVMLALAGCGENLYSLTNKTLLDQMSTDIAYIQDNCEQVIKNLEEKQLTIPLSVDEKYQYVSSLLSCSGFDVRASLAMALGPGDEFDDSTDADLKNGPLDVMYSFIKKETYTTETITELNNIYSKALLQCSGRLNNNLRIVCSLVGGASNTLAVTKELLFILASPFLPADQNEILALITEYAGTAGQSPSTYVISKTLAAYPSMFIEDPDFESRLVRSAEAIQAGLSTLDSLIGNSNGSRDNLLITMLEAVSDTILDPGGLSMATVLSVMILEMFGL